MESKLDDIVDINFGSTDTYHQKYLSKLADLRNNFIKNLMTHKKECKKKGVNDEMTKAYEEM